MTFLFISTLASALLFLRITTVFETPIKHTSSTENKRAFREVLDVTYEPLPEEETSESAPRNL